MLMNDVRKLLPIGSVVRLQGAEKRLMIFGIRQTDEDTGTEYDYVAVLYPEGNMGENVRFMFDNEDIEETVFVGYSDEERTSFLEDLKTFFDEKEQE